MTCEIINLNSRRGIEENLEFTIAFRRSSEGLYFQLFGASDVKRMEIAEALETAAERLREEG